MDFLANKTGTSPKTLQESFRKLKNLSSGFCDSWINNDFDDAAITSGEALELLDHIQNELLRHRDDNKALPNWAGHPLRSILSLPVGKFINDSSEYKSTFFSYKEGEAAIPNSAITTTLNLEQALNKLKHRVSQAVNFSISSTNTHMIYIYTNSGMGHPDSISELNINEFCHVGKQASNSI